MWQCILYVNFVKKKVGSHRQKKFIISCLYRKVAHTQEIISSHCVSPAMQKFTLTEETDGTENDDPVGVSKSLQLFIRATGVGFRVNFRKSFQGNRPPARKEV